MNTRIILSKMVYVWLLLGLVSVGHSANIYWVSDSSGYFDDIGNWNSSAAPGVDDAIYFLGSPSPATEYTVTLRSDVSVQRIWAEKGSQIFDLSGYTLTLNQTGASHAIAVNSYDGPGVTQFQNGSIDSWSAVSIGGGDRGERTRELVFDDVVLNFKSTTNATLRNINVGIVTNGRPAAPNGVSGHKLLITGGSEFNNANEIIVGIQAGAERNVFEISGGSQVNALGNFRIRRSNNSVLVSEDSRLVVATTQLATLANENEVNNRITLEGDMSSYQTNWMQIGAATGVKTDNVLEVKGGTLNVGSVGQASGAYLYVLGTGGNQALLTGGTVNVRNANREGYIRSVGNNQIVIDGAVVNVDQVRILSTDGNGIEFRGGELNVHNHITSTTLVAAVGDFTVGDGIGESARLNLIGMTEANRTRDLTMLADAIIHFHIEGLDSTEYSRFLVERNLIYAGALSVEIAGYTPDLGDAFQLFSGFSGYSGTFDELLLPELDEGLKWSFDYSTGALNVEAVPEPSVFAALFGLFVWLAWFKRKR